MTGSTRGSRKAWFAGLALAAAVTPGTSHAGRDGPRLPAAVGAVVAGAEKRIDAYRAALGSGGMADRLARGLALSGGPPLPIAPPRAVEPDRGLLRSLPAPIADAVALLEAATRRALTLVGPATRERPVDWMARARAAIRTASLATGVHAPSIAPARPDVAGSGAAQAQAALILSTAIDRALPALRSAPAIGKRGANVSGCDLVDRTPLLCVGSDANNTYTKDAVLLIDLGGNDTYLNSAGGAPFPTRNGRALLGVSVTVDVAGDDTYLASRPVPGFDNFVVAQGAAVFGGIGFLVDAGGNDRYTAVAPAGAGGVVAQGAGLGGIGVLFDLGGDDSYSARSRPAESTPAVAILAQGAALLCAQTTPVPAFTSAGCPFGALLDVGGGNDTYDIRADSRSEGSPSAILGATYAAGQGIGDFGAGVVYDDGGIDHFSVTTNVERSSLKTGGAYDLEIHAQGNDVGGDGLLLEGAGATTYEVTASFHGFGTALVDGQGVAEGPGSFVGAIDDRGGNDRYIINASQTDARDLIVGDDCRCRQALAIVEAYPQEGGTVPGLDVAAQGSNYAAPGSTGLIRDTGGSDLYEVVARHDFRVTLDDRLSAPASPPRLDVTAYPVPSIAAQGVGEIGAGLLLDGSGSDRYRLRSLNETVGEATSLHASGSPTVLAVSPENSAVVGQGSAAFDGVGVLMDGGGSGDEFDAEVSNHLLTIPVASGAYVYGGDWPAFQGDGSVGVFIARGAGPRIHSSPAQAACGSPGERGYGTWTGCSAPAADPNRQEFDGAGGASLGYAPAAAGVRPQLDFAPQAARSVALDPRSYREAGVQPSVLRTAASLRDPGGHAMPGAVLHFDLQLCTQNCDRFPSWFNYWQVDGVTDGNGMARAGLPLVVGGFPADLSTDYASYRWRVAATFDGEPGFYSRRAALPLTL